MAYIRWIKDGGSTALVFARSVCLYLCLSVCLSVCVVCTRLVLSMASRQIDVCLSARSGHRQRDGRNRQPDEIIALINALVRQLMHNNSQNRRCTNLLLPNIAFDSLANVFRISLWANTANECTTFNVVNQGGIKAPYYVLAPPRILRQPAVGFYKQRRVNKIHPIDVEPFMTMIVAAFGEQKITYSQTIAQSSNKNKLNLSVIENALIPVLQAAITFE